MSSELDTVREKGLTAPRFAPDGGGFSGTPERGEPEPRLNLDDMLQMGLESLLEYFRRPAPGEDQPRRPKDNGAR